MKDNTKKYMAIGGAILMVAVFIYFGNKNGVATVLPPKTTMA